jgi:hypothetical protein
MRGFTRLDADELRTVFQRRCIVWGLIDLCAGSFFVFAAYSMRLNGHAVFNIFMAVGWWCFATLCIWMFSTCDVSDENGWSIIEHVRLTDLWCSLSRTRWKSLLVSLNARCSRCRGKRYIRGPLGGTIACPECSGDGHARRGRV